MYCKRCGRRLSDRDNRCSGCGITRAEMDAMRDPFSDDGFDFENETETTSGGGGKTWGKDRITLLLVLVALVGMVLVLLLGKGFSGRDGKPEDLPAEAAQEEDPLPGDDVLENLYYGDGTPKRTVEDTGDCIEVLDYYRNGSLRQILWIVLSEDGNGSHREAVRFDKQGNPTERIQRNGDDTLWLYIFYENTYDSQNRPVSLRSFNRNGEPLTETFYTYEDNGCYRQEIYEFRGPVYEYEFQEDPERQTVLWYHAILSCDALGNVLEETVDVVDGVPILDYNH